MLRNNLGYITNCISYLAAIFFITKFIYKQYQNRTLSVNPTPIFLYKLIQNQSIQITFNYIYVFLYNYLKNDQLLIKMSTDQARKLIFTCSDIIEINNYLTDHPELNPAQFRDKQGNNVLHQLAYRNEIDALKLYINHCARYYQHKLQAEHGLYRKTFEQEVKQWVNQINNEGFTPFLYAAYNGHLQAMRYLEQAQAEISCRTKTGLNAFHLAAQNNKVNTFIYLRERLDINSEDNNNSTPLHWASYLGSEQIVAYILAQKQTNIDLRDHQGQTALMLATIYGNTKIVRRLLIKGAGRNISNNKGQLPIKIAQENSFKNISKMLNNKYSLWDMVKFYYNVKIQYKPKDRSIHMPVVFIVCTLISIAIMNTLLVPNQFYYYYIEGGIFGLLLLLYISLIINPKIPRKKSYSQLLESNKKICFQCQQIVPKRGYHCDVCHVCIKQYDHHCTWINNCVGKKNIARFILFLFVLLISLAVIGLVSVLSILEMIIKDNLFGELFHFREQRQSTLIVVGKSVLFALNLVISLFFFPVFMLFTVQLKNLCINRTTFERFQTKVNRESQGSVRSQYRGKKYKNTAYIKNCRMMCSQNRQSIASENSLDQKLIQ